MAAMAARVGESLPVGNEGAGVVVEAGARTRRRRCLARPSPCSAARCTRSTACVKAAQCLVLPPGDDAGRRRVVLRQPAHRARHGRDDAPRGPHRARAHRGRVEPRPDAAAALHRRRRWRWSTSCASPSRRSCCKRGRRRARVQLELADVHGRSHRGARRDRRHDRVRRHRRRPARRPDPDGAWRSRPTATATEYSRYGSTTHKQVYIYGGLDRGPTEFNRNFGMAWGIGGWLLHAVPAEDRRRSRAEAARARGARDQDHVREHVHERSLAGRGAAARTRSRATAKQATGEKYLITPNKGL